LGPKLWPNVECTRLLRKACGAEESGGALAESQAFLGAGKRGLSGRECTRFGRAKVLRKSGRWRTSGFTADYGVGFSVYCGGATRSGGTEGQKRGSERARGGSGGERLVHEQPEEYLYRQASEG
jgi:hypothetical protein